MVEPFILFTIFDQLLKILSLAKTIVRDEISFSTFIKLFVLKFNSKRKRFHICQLMQIFLSYNEPFLLVFYLLARKYWPSTREWMNR